LSSNGIAAFLLANGALGDPDTLSIRRKIIENNLVEAIIVLPRDMFYSTDISVTLWIINKNKNKRVGTQNGLQINYRDRQEEVLFMDLRRLGLEFEKKYVQLTDEEINLTVSTFHNWQRDDSQHNYRDIPEFCYSASKKEIQENGYSLIPSKYIEFIDGDLNIDYSKEMKRIQNDFKDILSQEKDTQAKIIEAFKGLGYEIKL
jgi:type I restriction enzyme M protein